MTVHVRHHDVEQHDVELPLAHQAQRFGTAVDALHRVSLPRQAAVEHIAIALVVVHHQDVGRLDGRLLARFRRRRDLVVIHGRRSAFLGAGHEVLIDDLEHAPSGGADLLKIAGRAVPLRRFLRQHLRVADDLIESRSKVVKERRGEVEFSRSGAHGIRSSAATCSRLSIFPRRRDRSIGLVS